MVRVRFGAGGICGSDMHYFRHARTGDFVVTSPLVLGHEVAGEIVEINGDAPGLAVGDRVAVNPSRWCGHCAYCHEGRAEPLREHLLHGLGVEDAAYAGRLRQPVRRDARAMRQGPATPALSGGGARRAARGLPARGARAASVGGKSVVLFGAGPIGLLTLLAARLKGAASQMVDIAAAPLAFATAWSRQAQLTCRRRRTQDDAAQIPLRRRFRDFWHRSWPWLGDRQRQARWNCCSGGQSSGWSDCRAANAVMAKEIDLKGTFRFGTEFSEAVG